MLVLNASNCAPARNIVEHHTISEMVQLLFVEVSVARYVIFSFITNGGAYIIEVLIIIVLLDLPTSSYNSLAVAS